MSKQNISSWLDVLLELKGEVDNGMEIDQIGKELLIFRDDFHVEAGMILEGVKNEDFIKKLKSSTPKELIDYFLETEKERVKKFVGIFPCATSIKNETEQKELLERILSFRIKHKFFNQISFDKLEATVKDLSSYSASDYNAGVFLNRLSLEKVKYNSIKARIIDQEPQSDLELAIFIEEYKALKKEILLSNPLVKNKSIVFVTRQQYAPDHHNSATLFHTNEVNTKGYRPGGTMKVIDMKNDGQIITLIETSDGVVRDPEISYDGKRILFSMRKNIEEDYHIYEMNIDGGGIQQLTAAEGVSDIDPQYLPDGDIVFSSTREPKYCMCNIHIMANIFRMEADGANITQLGKSTLFEGHSTIMPDGRILYDRWEYIDRNFGDAQGLWTMNPDGTNQAVYFGNNTNSPGGFIDARPIPGTDKVICILGSCHDRPWGALGIIDRKKGIDGKDPVERTWPAKAKELVGVGYWDTFLGVRPLYEDPYPLSDKYFLCSRSIGKGEQMGLFLIDVFGNEQLIHTEAPGCYDPVPIQPRSREYSIQDKRNFKSETGKFYVQDVYQGTHMKGVKRGTVKYLRVVESVEKRSWTEPAWSGQGVHRPAMNWHSFECKKIWGTVPVEEDGSAYFEVPADKYVYFQLLDENKMMVQSMRSGTMVHSGETLGCIGCHEDRRMAPPSTMMQTSMALQKAPQQLQGWYGDARNFGFAEEVQPVLDKHCVKCHDFGKKIGDKLNLSGDRNPYFNAAYIDMYLNKVIKPIGAGPAEVQGAKSWGSHPSKLIKMVRDGHANVKLSEEEMERLVTWIDINAVYYSDFISAYPDNTVGRSPITQEELNRLGKLTKVDFGTLAGHGRLLPAQVSFERPALSPCLKNIRNKNSAEYKESLDIITKGKEKLEKQPRRDMPNFVPSKKDQERLNKYIRRQEEEMRNREAIQSGTKHYDPELQRGKQ
jgi:hypothetical protein